MDFKEEQISVLNKNNSIKHKLQVIWEVVSTCLIFGLMTYFLGLEWLIVPIVIAILGAIWTVGKFIITHPNKVKETAITVVVILVAIFMFVSIQFAGCAGTCAIYGVGC